jgi:uncharacterized protein
MSAPTQPLDVVQAAYAAFGRGDIPSVLEFLADDDIDWKFCGPKGMPYTGSCHTKSDVAKWFASIPEADDIQAFEPREFITGGDSVTVLGWEKTRAVPSGKVFEADWVHVFTVRNGRVVRFWGMLDTEASAAARS